MTWKIAEQGTYINIWIICTLLFQLIWFFDHLIVLLPINNYFQIYQFKKKKKKKKGAVHFNQVHTFALHLQPRL